MINKRKELQALLDQESSNLTKIGIKRIQKLKHELHDQAKKDNKISRS